MMTNGKTLQNLIIALILGSYVFTAGSVLWLADQVRTQHAHVMDVLMEMKGIKR